MVDCGGVKNRRAERFRGFESLPIRKLKNLEGLDKKLISVFCKGLILFAQPLTGFIPFLILSERLSYIREC